MRIEDEFLSTEDFVWLVDNLVRNENIPYYLNQNQHACDEQKFLGHTIVLRPELAGEEEEAKIRSETLYPIVKDLLKKGGETNFEILRASVNVTFRNSHDRKTTWHHDHLCDYKHLIYYLTTHDDAPTVIKNTEGEEVVIDAFANRAVFFERQLHRGTMPEYGLRAVIVVTYKSLQIEDKL